MSARPAASWADLLVPVCLSATHVAWGAVRLEPVWMQTGEAAGFATARYFGAKGFFAGYDARLDEPLTEAVRDVWREGFGQLDRGSLDPVKLASAVHAAELRPSPPTEERRGDALQRLWERL